MRGTSLVHVRRLVRSRSSCSVLPCLSLHRGAQIVRLFQTRSKLQERTSEVVRESNTTILTLDQLPDLNKVKLSDIESVATKKVRKSRKKSASRKKQTQDEDESIETTSSDLSKTTDIELESLDDFDRGAQTEENSLTDFYQGLKDTIDKYSQLGDDYIVLIQVGSFYELYFEHAEKFSSILGLKLTKKKLKSQEVAFSGFPEFKLDKYLSICFNNGLKAVVCDQITDPVTNTIGRPVNRLITPGTIVDEGLRDYHKNNFLLAISFPDDPFKDMQNMKIGLCWTDIGLGSFFVLESTINDLMANVTRINPSELILNDSLDIEKLISGRWYPELGDLKKYYITKQSLPKNRKKLTDFHEMFSDNKKLVIATLDTLNQKEIAATVSLLTYVEQCLPKFKTNFALPRRSLPKTLLHIDPRASLDLELTETIRGGFKTGALFGIIDQTVTAPGARLLQSWLLAPSTSVREIKDRQNLVTVFLRNPILCDELKLILRKTSDVGRIVRRTDNNRAELSEFLDLSKTIFLIESMSDMIINSDKYTQKYLTPIFEKFNDSPELIQLAKRIEKSISTKASVMKFDYFYRADMDVVRRDWSLKSMASKRLSELRKEYDQLLKAYELLEDKFKEELQELGYNGSIKFIRDYRTYEFLVALKSTSKTMTNVVKSEKYEFRDRNKTAVRILSPEWKKLGYELVDKEREIVHEETVIVDDLKQDLLKLAKELRMISPIIEMLDVTTCFANLAKEKNLVAPIVDKSDTFEIVDGRHLVVEEGLKNSSSSLGLENFTSNSCSLNNSNSSGWIITGPNMGGKSTFLRQNALITILAQMGSFVPAAKAHIGVIDKIFTRVGSSDNIYRHQSTFMVEMNETAVILRDATERSLAIVDELGRGTSTLEGVSVAYASLSHLIKYNKCKVLFATHFGPELEHLIKDDGGLREKIHYYHTDLSKISKESNLPVDERIIFNHKLHKGISYHSHAFEVAELAGFPTTALDLAERSYVKLTGDTSGKGII